MTKRWVPLRDFKMCSQYVLPRAKWKLSLAFIYILKFGDFFVALFQGAAESLLLEGKSSIFIIITIIIFRFLFVFIVFERNFVAEMSSSFRLWICSPCFIFRLLQNQILNSTHFRLVLMRDNRNNRNEFIFDSEPPNQ